MPIGQWLALILSLALCLLAAPVTAQETGTTSYAALYRALQPVLDVGRHDRLLATANVQSKLPQVSPAAIRMEIRSRSGVRRLSIADDGNFDFPVDAGLLAEDPAVVSNQPRGSLTLTVILAFRPYPTLRVPYREISKALAQASEVITADRARSLASARGLEVHFAPGHDATVAIRGDNERTFMAGADGRVVLIDNPQWRGPDVEVEFSERPLRLMPYIDTGDAR